MSGYMIQIDVLVQPRGKKCEFEIWLRDGPFETFKEAYERINSFPKPKEMISRCQIIRNRDDSIFDFEMK